MQPAGRIVDADGAIVVDSLFHIYAGEGENVTALRGLDLSVRTGDMIGILGPSGSGKSTLLRLLAGLEVASAGRLVVNGRNLSRATSRDLAWHRRHCVAMVDQHYWRSISPYLSARETVELPLRLRGWPRVERMKRVGDLLERVGLGDRMAALPSQLSGGQQQRVAIAAAVAARPAILLADEPTGELDRANANEVLMLFRELVDQEGMTAIIVTHDVLVEGIADRIVHLHQGRLIAETSPRKNGSVRRIVDPSGWLAPDLPSPPAALSRTAATPRGEIVVRLQDVGRSYGRGVRTITAIRTLNAQIPRGGIHVVTGPSGSGKSTLLRLMIGLDRPTSGTVEALGLNLEDLDRTALAEFRAAHVSTVSQPIRMIPFLTPVENLGLDLELRGVRAVDERHRRAEDAIDRVGLRSVAETPLGSLSGGERARVALARAIASQSEILVLDEPTAALDRASALRMIEGLTQLDPTMTVIAGTHDAALIAIADTRLDLAKP